MGRASLLGRFTELMQERFDVTPDSGDRRNVLHIWRRRSRKDEHEGGLKAIFGRITGPGDFGIYLHEGATQGFWGASTVQIARLTEEYGNKWIMILLEDDVNIGYLYTSEEIAHNLSAWSTDITGSNLKIVRETLGFHRKFSTTPILLEILAEAGLESKVRD